MKKRIATACAALAALPLTAATLTWEALDADGDGLATKEEYLEAQKTISPKAGPENHAKWFKNIDKNKDGSIDPEEWERNLELKAQREAKKGN